MKTESKDLLVQLLQELREEQKTGAPMAGDVFNALLSVVPQTNVEFIVCRKDIPTRGTEVLLVQRPQDVLSYPGQWHAPGVFIQNGETLQDVYERISLEKMGGTPIKRVNFLDFQVYNDPIRLGTIVRLVHLVEIEGKPLNGKFFKLSNLPEDLVWDQRMLLVAAKMHNFQQPQSD